MSLNVKNENPLVSELSVGEGFSFFYRLLGERGFRLSRGTYRHGNGDILPTVVIDRPSAPGWSGVWSPWEAAPELPGEVAGETQMILDVASAALTKWDAEAYLFLPLTINVDLPCAQ